MSLPDAAGISREVTGPGCLRCRFLCLRHQYAACKLLQAMSERHLDAVIVTCKDRLVGVLTGMDVCCDLAVLLRDNLSRPHGGASA